MSIDYSNYEYEGLVEKITDLYKNKPGVGGGYDSATGQMLIELLADSTDNLHYMLERRSQESFLTTARITSSIWAHASEVGYRPHRKISSLGTLELTLTNENGDVITPVNSARIEKGTTVVYGGDTYTTMEDVLFSSSESTKTIKIKEGKPKEDEFNFSDPAQEYIETGEIVFSDFSDMEEYSLVVFDSAGDQYYDVRDPNSGYLNVTSLTFAPPEAKLYDIKYSHDGMRIVFGDGEYGFKPTGNITVRWVSSTGGDASYVATGRDFTFNFNKIPDQVSMGDEYSYTMKNISSVRGGLDEEDNRSIRMNAPSYVRSANRAVTSDDYRFWVKKSGIGDIVDLNVYSEHDTKNLIYTMNNVFVTYLTSDNVPLNLTQRIQLREFINQYKTITNHVIIDEADKVNMALDINAKKGKNLPVTREHFFNIITSLCQDYLDVKEGAIGRFFQHSEFIEYMQNAKYKIDGVRYKVFDYLHVDVEAEYVLETPPVVYEVSVELSTTYTPTAGDVLTLVIDGVEYSTPINTSQSILTIMNNVTQEVFNNSNLMVALDGTTLFIRAASETSTFEFHIADNGATVTDFVRSSIIYNLPRPAGDDLDVNVVPGSAYIMNNDRTVVLYEDDGGGSMRSRTPGGASFRIDYRTGKISTGLLFENNVIVRYKQDRFKNFKADQATAVLLAPFSSYFDNMETGASKVKVIEKDGG